MEILNKIVSDEEFSNKTFLLRYLSTCSAFIGCRVTMENIPSSIVVGGSSPDKTMNKNFRLIEFANAIENMKNNFIIPAKRLIEKLDFTKKEQKADSCFSQNKELYEFENCLFRLGSLWDAGAQFINIRDDLKMETRFVTAEKLFGNNGEKSFQEFKVTPKEDIQQIFKYFSNPDSLDGINVRDFIRRMRNYLTHFCDLASGKFISSYFENDDELKQMAIDLNVYPTTTLTSFLMFDFVNYISFFSKIIDDWASSTLKYEM
jgi:hypothetical protein